jgi:hypothetical protein
VNEKLSWLQRGEIATALYKNDWRAAVAAAPEHLRPELQALCDERNLLELADDIHPSSDGVVVDAADWGGAKEASVQTS